MFHLVFSIQKPITLAEHFLQTDLPDHTRNATMQRASRSPTIHISLDAKTPDHDSDSRPLEHSPIQTQSLDNKTTCTSHTLHTKSIHQC